MSCRVLPSPLPASPVEVFDHLLDRDLVALGDFLGDFLRRAEIPAHFQSAQQPDVVNHPRVAGSAVAMCRMPLRFPAGECGAFDKFGGQRADVSGDTFKLGEAVRWPIKDVRLVQGVSTLNRRAILISKLPVDLFMIQHSTQRTFKSSAFLRSSNLSFKGDGLYLVLP